MKKRRRRGKRGAYHPNTKGGRAKSDASYFGAYPRKYVTPGYRA